MVAGSGISRVSCHRRAEARVEEAVKPGGRYQERGSRRPECPGAGEGWGRESPRPCPQEPGPQPTNPVPSVSVLTGLGVGGS